jgi:hypothetical protein
MFVDATLHVANDTQNLKVTMWGNVAGSRSSAPLPPANDTAYWNDSSKTDGKILRIPDSQKNIVTTLHSKLNVLTYEPWNGDFDFCTNLTSGHNCPLSPVFNFTKTSCVLPLPIRLFEGIYISKPTI